MDKQISKQFNIQVKPVQVGALSSENHLRFVQLVYQSGQSLFDLMFDGADKAYAFLSKACAREHGQFGYLNHHFVFSHQGDSINDRALVACATFWTANPSDEFQQQTLASLKANLSIPQLSVLTRINEDLMQTFKAPLKHELGIGHLSVHQDSRGLSIATQFLNLAVEQAFLLEKKTLVLDVESTNESAIGCYKKFGFKDVRLSQLGNTSLCFYRMHLDL